jgi:DNA-binding beta-propeller fold protein YncE
VNAPKAQALAMATKRAHPELQKLGLHAVPPGQPDYAIIACSMPSKIGKKSSANDLAVIASGKPAVKNDERGKFFDLCLPLSDSEGQRIGVTVMEIPYAFARNADEALEKASAIRAEMEKEIPGRGRLFVTTDAPLIPSQTIKLPADIKGRFDHFSVDLKRNRLFATAQESHVVLVLDLVTAELIARIDGLSKPHAILYRPDIDRIFVTDGDGALAEFDGTSYKLVKKLELAKDADAIGYDPERRYLYVVNGGGDAGDSFSRLSVIDTTSLSKVDEIRVEGETLEAMALDIWRSRLYVNDKAKSEVTVVDRWTKKVTAAWPVTMGKENEAMALDEARQRLFVGCRSGHIVVFDSNTGKELQALAASKGIDDLVYDPASSRLYAIGAGAVTVYEEKDADHFKRLGEISVGTKAKTGLLVPQLNRYYAAEPQADHSNAAAIHVLQTLNVSPGAPAAVPERQTVRAPWALQLEMETLSAHPHLRKMGLHAVPPDGKDSVIIANGNTARIGIKSSQSDLDAVKEGATYCSKRDAGSFYNLKLPLKDAAGRRVGILVMELPFTSAPDEAAAVKMAEGIREELAMKIRDYNSLFR